MTVLRVNTIAGTGTTFGPTLEGNLEFNSQNYIVLPKGTSTQEGVLRTTADVVGTGGTFYDNLVLAMPFNAATGLTDVSSRNRNPAAYGNVAISTAQSKYYGSSAYFDGSGDYLVVNPGISSDFMNWWETNFTIEAWVYADSYSSWDVGGIDPDRIPLMIGNMNPGDNINFWSFGPINNNKVEFYYWKGSQNHTFITTNTLSTGVWSHIAMSYTVANGAKLFINGVGTNYITLSGTPQSSNTVPITIGSWSNSSPINGYIQDLRIYKGVAKYTANFTPPDRIAEIGVGFKAGQLRYNTDSNKVELYDGNQWTEVQASRPDLNGGARGVWGGGDAPGVQYNVIDYITISTTGNATDFGDLTVAHVQCASCSSNTRGIFAGGFTSPGGATLTNVIDFITISSTSNAQDFGDLTLARRELGGLSNSTRGIFGGGITPTASNVIEYITISSVGNAVDFGDLITARGRCGGNIASPVRGIFGSGYAPTSSNVIEYITISTLGNAFDFGDLSLARGDAAGLSNSTRGLLGGGYTPTLQNTIDYITIATLGNAVKFGELTDDREGLEGCASPTRGVWGGGYAPGFTNVMDYVTILTQGNAVDFGDLSVIRSSPSACSNAHGGL